MRLHDEDFKGRLARLAG